MSQPETLSARMRRVNDHGLAAFSPISEWATEVEALENQIAQWRILAFTQHACQAKYGDDGELQCNQCLIDFKRDSIEEINAKLYQRGILAMQAEQAKDKR